jgi:hypothetical protein
MTNGQQSPANGECVHDNIPGNYGPVRVTMTDSLGTIFLGVLALILLVGLLRSEARYRALVARPE